MPFPSPPLLSGPPTPAGPTRPLQSLPPSQRLLAGGGRGALWLPLLWLVALIWLSGCTLRRPTSPPPTARPPSPTTSPSLTPIPLATLTPTPTFAPHLLQAEQTLRFAPEGHLAAAPALDAQGRFLAVAYGDGRVLYTSLEEPHPVTLYAPSEPLDLLPLLALAPQGTWLLATGQAEGAPLPTPNAAVVRRWRLGPGAKASGPRTFGVGDRSVHGLTIAPDGDRWAVGASVGLGGGQVSVWSNTANMPLWREQTEDWITGVAFGPDGVQLAAATYGRVLLFDVQTGTLLEAFSIGDEPFWTVCYGADGHTLVLASNALLYGVALDDGSVRFALPLDEPLPNPILSVVCSPRGPWVGVAQSDGVHWYHLHDGTPLGVTPTRILPSGIALNPQGTRLVVVYPDGQVDLYPLP